MTCTKKGISFVFQQTASGGSSWLESLEWISSGWDLISINFTNKLRAAFAPIFLRQKSTNRKSKYKKTSRETFYEKAARKMLVKLTLGKK